MKINEKIVFAENQIKSLFLMENYIIKSDTLLIDMDGCNIYSFLVEMINIFWTVFTNHD